MSATDTSAEAVERLISSGPHAGRIGKIIATLRALLAERDAALAKVAALEADAQHASAFAAGLAARLSALEATGAPP